MLYRLEIENFYCIRDRQVLDLTVPRTTPESSERFSPIFQGSDLRVPKVIAIYGANGSGKSTVLRALSFIAWFVRDSFQHVATRLPCERFNDQESAVRPVRLAIEFGGTMQLTREAQGKAAEGLAVPRGVYRYELELGTRDSSVTYVSKETLRRKREGRGKWLRVFERRSGKELLGSDVFSLSGYARVIDKIRDDASILATLALFEHEPAQVLVAAARTIVSNILMDKTDLSDNTIVQILSQNPASVEELNRSLQRIDVGIQEMKIIPTINGPTPMFKHEGLLWEMPLSLESHGTRSFIRMFPWLTASLSAGGIAIIDELDISIHPLVLPEIVRWYYDLTRNPKDAQLWMTLHSASLLDDLVKEEIVLCEKDRQGRTKIYSLMDMKAIRRSDSLYRKYLGGMFGAVPRIG
jgi:AAA15 family ATPase/GTPase